MGTIADSIEILSREKGIDKQIVIDALKDAMMVAARKHYKANEELEADFDPKTGAVRIFSVRKVVEQVLDPQREVTLADARKVNPALELESQLRIALPTESLGRIAAQTAKQVILQKVREAERETIFSEYAHRIGELVTCTVKRVEGPDLVVDLGKTEARITKKEQSRLENYTVGERVRGVIKGVEKMGKNAGVVVSRAAPELVMRLFEQEVPEIYDGTVVIKGCAREAGERTKITVMSRDRDVDSVGACVGMKGMRVQSIIRELRGEKIDIIEFSDDPVVFATHALSPAKITRVQIVNSVERHMEVIVDDTQLSLAIGKKGQNVRLAAKLLGWKIDIKSEEEKRQEVEAAMASLVPSGAPVSVLIDYGLTERVVEHLLQAGIGTVERLGAMTPEEIVVLPGIGLDGLDEIRAAVNSYYGQFEEPYDGQTTADTAQEEPGPAPSATDGETAAAVGGETAAAAGEEPAKSEPAAVPEVDSAEPEAASHESDTIEDAGKGDHPEQALPAPPDQP